MNGAPQFIKSCYTHFRKKCNELLTKLHVQREFSHNTVRNLLRATAKMMFYEHLGYGSLLRYSSILISAQFHGDEAVLHFSV
jgi:hypothetical protein